MILTELPNPATVRGFLLVIMIEIHLCRRLKMKILRCMAYQQNGVFVAACLDLSLAAQADTMQEAIDKLDSQINDYLDQGLSEPEFAAQMLQRKSPESMWFKYWLIAFRMFFRKQGQAKLFSKPL